MTHSVGRFFAFALAFWLSAFAAVSPAHANRVIYTCDDGFQIPVEFDGGESATVFFPDAPPAKLAGQPVGSGMHYESDGVVLRGKGDEATITRASDGNAFVCQAIVGPSGRPGEGPRDQERQGTASGARADPSFRCEGELLPAERQICSSPALAALDRNVADLYAAALSGAQGDARETVVAHQRAWLGGRNACGADEGCLDNAYRDRLSELQSGAPAGDVEDAPPGQGGKSQLAGPMKGRSFGGKVRAKPSMDSAQVASLKENDPITILRGSGQFMGEWEWFEIEWRGKRGYQWGGIMCSNQPVAGIFEVCR